MWDAFYMTVITITTVGFREVFPLSRQVQAFTVLLLVAGLGLIFVVATEIGRSMLEGEIRRVLGRMRRSRMLDRVRDHEVICGYGRMGKAVVEALRQAGRPLVVVEKNPEKVASLDALGVPVVRGDATQEEVLIAAGVARARGLVACLADDAHNAYTVLTARSVNPNLFIVALASEDGAEQRLLRAGANRVVNPYRLGGVRLVPVLTKPAVVDFLELSLGPKGQGLELEEVAIEQNSPLESKSLQERDLRRKFQSSDTLVVMGTKASLEAFETALLLETNPKGGER